MRKNIGKLLGVLLLALLFAVPAMPVDAADGTGSIEVTIKYAHPNLYRNDQYPTYRGYPYLPQASYGGGAASLLDSTGQVVDSFSGASRYSFADLPPGEYDIRLDVLDRDEMCLVAGTHNGTPISQIIVWSEDSPLLHVTIPEGGSDVVRRWVFVEFRSYGFKTVTDIGTFSGNPNNSRSPGAGASEDGKECVYYPVRAEGNNWDFNNNDPGTLSYIPYVHAKMGIYHGEMASQYQGMTYLQVPALSEEEQAMEYEFKGWQLEGDSSGKIYSEQEALNYPVTDHVVFKAVWETPYAIVSFDGNGGGGEMEAVKVRKGSDYTLPANGFTAPKGKLFDGWDKGAEGSVIHVTEDTLITAQWTEESGEEGTDEPLSDEPLSETPSGDVPGAMESGTEAPAVDEPGAEEPPAVEEDKASGQRMKAGRSPKTGDESELLPWLALMSLSLLGMAAARRRRKQEN